jgi:long-chain fatty acid transport protein
VRLSKYVKTFGTTWILSQTLLFQNLMAGNGFLPIGSGRNLDLGGAGVAFATDAASSNTNPALAARVGNSLYGFFGPQIFDQDVDTTKAPLSNHTKKQRNHITWMPVGTVALNCHYKPGWTMNFANNGGGSGVRLKHSIFDKHIHNTNSKQNFVFSSFAANLAYSPNCYEAYGISLVGALTGFRSNALTLQGIRTIGNSHWNYAWGFGFKVGGVWDLSPRATFGAAYTSPIWFERLDKYKDLLKHPINPPPILNAGFAFHLPRGFDFLLDVRQIFWRDQKSTGASGKNGGLGWKNQTVVALGLQHDDGGTFIKRIGINIARCIMNRKDLFLSTLTMVPGHTTLTGGFTYRYTRCLEFDLHGEYQFLSKTTDNGHGVLGPLTKGTKLSGSYGLVLLGINWNFN